MGCLYPHLLNRWKVMEILIFRNASCGFHISSSQSLRMFSQINLVNSPPWADWDTEEKMEYICSWQPGGSLENKKGYKKRRQNRNRGMWGQAVRYRFGGQGMNELSQSPRGSGVGILVLCSSTDPFVWKHRGNVFNA